MTMNRVSYSSFLTWGGSPLYIFPPRLIVYFGYATHDLNDHEAARS
jgi:hypothetical protein